MHPARAKAVLDLDQDMTYDAIAAHLTLSTPRVQQLVAPTKKDSA